MYKKGLFLIILVLVTGFSSKILAQNEIIHFAHFVNDETNVYKDINGRLVMNFTISNVVDQNDLQNLQYKFDHYGTFETVQFSVTNDLGVYSVYTVSSPGVRAIDLRKLFVSCGIFTIFIDDQPYPSQDFSPQMLNSN
ncbi:MAG: hypothetical protein C0592_04160 [Marinilabiliales bacterium]|nr:MAG: hypothetical protein C0592_04160 [Marinilabiliales bacterium]